MDTIWELKDYDQLLATQISRQLGISMPVALLLIQRGISSVQEAERFLYGKREDLADPYAINGVKDSVQRIEKAISGGEKVVIYGDYDVDGICSTVLLKECLAELGCQADYYVPDRFTEGYGLNITAVNYLSEQGYELLITVDCGITSIAEIEQAVSLGMDVIVTDHHTPLDILPVAFAVINPKLDKQPEYINLAGVGVAFQLARALCNGKIDDDRVFAWLDLVALATVADIVPVLGDNRILVKYGLERLQETTRLGLKALITETGLDGKPLLAWHIGYILAPRLNAAGRLDNARTSIELLLCNDPQRANELAVTLCNLNNERRTIEEAIFKEAVLQIEAAGNLEEQPVLVLAGEGWHQGVIGIVASRLSDKYNRPAILISWEGDIGKGSGRSTGNFDLYQALYYCREILLQFGGHRLAAGLSIEKSQFAKFREIMTSLGKSFIPINLTKKYRIDIELEYDDINNGLLQEINLLQPYGEGNDCPCFVLRSGEIIRPILVGKNKDHLKFSIGTRSLDAIAFNGSHLADLPWRNCRQDILFELAENEFRGNKNIQLKVKDMKCTCIPDNYGLDKETPDILIFKRIIQELISKQPVLFIYPTYRNLIKHQMAVNHYFLPGIVTIMHGRLSQESRMASEKMMNSGEARIFQMTQPFFKYYRRKYGLPPNLHYIVLIWPPDDGKGWNDLRNKYEIAVLPTMHRNFDGSWIKKSWDFTSQKRTVVYTNRNQTLEKLNDRLSVVNSEAGVNSLTRRKRIRRQFLISDTGTLLYDGACTSGLPPLENVDELILADVPYSGIEISSILDQIAHNPEIETTLLFGEQDLDFNRSYLNRIYPDINLVKDVWRYFRSLGFRPIYQEPVELANKITGSLQKRFDISELVPVLQILSDLGLCQVKKKGSIMEIKFITSEISTLDISESPYYLEGIAEKKAFARLEGELHKFLVR